MLENIKTPEDLMIFLNKNIEYGVKDSNGNKITDGSSEQFQFVCNNEWFLRPVKQILLDKIGHCYDQVEIERYWFENNGYKVKTIWISAYQENIENSGFSHTYLVYKDKNQWKLFEHSDYFNRGIFEFNSLKDAINFQAKNQIKTAENCIKPEIKYSVCIKEYSKSKTNLNMSEFLEYIMSSKNVDFDL